MSIFQKQPIRVGDMVIGTYSSAWDGKGTIAQERSFSEPSLILEIKENSALVFLEQEGPVWYNLSNLERVYVTDEFTKEQRIAGGRIHGVDKSGYKADP